MKKIRTLLFIAVPVFGIGISTAFINTTNKPAVEAGEKNYGGSRKTLCTVKYDTEPKSEPQYTKQYPLNFSALNVGDVWNSNRGENVVVAVIDSGANIYHEDLLTKEAQGKTISSSNVEQYSILSKKSAHIWDPTDKGEYESTVTTKVGILEAYDQETYEDGEYYSHGTCCCSVIGAAVNGVGGTGLAPNVEIMAIRCDLYDTSINTAIRYAADNGANIISMSFGGYNETFTDGYGNRQTGYSGTDTSMQSAITYAYNKGCVLVAAAGNEKQGSHLSYPAANEHVIGVGALARGSSTSKADFSCWNVTKNGVILENNNADVFAPGYVWTAGVEDSKDTPTVYIETQGTSFACPLTAAACALYKSAYPTATPDEIEEALFSTCYDLGTAGRDASFGYGRVDVENLLTAVPLKNLSVSPTSANLTINADGTYNTQQLTVTFDPDNCDEEYKNGIWISNDEDIATVDENGLVTPVSGGTTQVGYIAGKGNISAQATITVIDNQNHPVKSLSLDQTSATIAIDKTIQLHTIFTPKYASNKNVTWNSTDEEVATVTGDGLVTGKAEGTAIISATSEDGGKVASCTVTVKKTVAKTSVITFQGNGGNDDSSSELGSNVSKIISSDSDTSFIASYSSRKAYQGKGSNGLKLGSGKSSGSITLNFKNTMIVQSVKVATTAYSTRASTVNVSIGSTNYGSVTGGTTGTITKDVSGQSLTISATSRSYINSIEVTYLSEGGGTTTVPVTGVSVNPTSATMEIGSTKTLTATVLPNDATNKSVSWSSSNSAVASVNNGVVTANAAGTATITVTTSDGNKTATCNITVNESTPTVVNVTGVTLDKTSVTLNINETATLSAVVAPSNATNKSVSWSTDDSSVVTVNNGVIKGIKAGTATITVTTSDGNKTATCIVTVNDDAKPEETVKVTGIKLSTNFARIKAGESITITAQVSPSNATNKTVLWETSDNSVATVTDGTVVGLKEGISIITAKTQDGNYFSVALITVYGSAVQPVETISVTGVTLDQSSASINVNETMSLSETVIPENATNKNVSWSSSDDSIATVDNGVITGIKAGTAVITVVTADGNKTATCIVTVNDNVEPSNILVNSISADKMINLTQGDTQQIKCSISPDNANNKGVTYSCDNTDVATVSEDGLVTAIKEGQCTVTITAKDGSGVKTTVTVYVSKANTNVITSFGCSGSVVAASALLSTLSLLGAGLLILKRKKEK